ncbi:MAG: 50S ribosomal protein L17 [Rhodothermales bacterium]
MRHRNKGFKLGRTHAHREATLASLSTALIEHKRIRTTLTKAKALRMYVEPLITRSKQDSTHNRREVFKRLQNKQAVSELFGAISSQIADRPGGYTRVVKLGPRPGDGAEMALIELVDYNVSEAAEPTGRRTRRTRRGGGRRGGKATASQPATSPEVKSSVETTETLISEKDPATGVVDEPVAEDQKKPVVERSDPHAEAREAAEAQREKSEEEEADDDKKSSE